MLRLASVLLFLITTTASASNYTTRVIGGQNSETSEWPTMVQLFEGNVSSSQATYFCGGTLISDLWVLTAAHCFVGDTGDVDKLPTDVFVIVKSPGTLGEGTRIPVSQILIHEQYMDANAFDADIALMELRDSVMDPPLQPIYQRAVLEGSSATIVGWGATSPSTGNIVSKELKDAQVPVVAQSDCIKAMGDQITNNMFCAGVSEGGVDTCPGDSGGPVLVKQDGGYLQVGITSWGPAACGSAGQYGVYTRLSRYTDWIMGKTGLSSIVVEENSGGGGLGVSLLLLFGARRFRGKA